MAAIKYYVDINLQGNILKNPAFDAGAIAIAALATNPLARANHTGTQTASTISDLAATVQAYTLNQFAAPTASVSMNSQLLTNVATPVSANDAANKSYVDSNIQGLSQKPSVRLATTAALAANTYSNGSSGVGATLTANANGALSIDGVAVATNDLVLIKNESSGQNNGLYTVTQAGDGTHPYILTRHVDMDTTGEFVGAFIPVESPGTTNANSLWLCTNTSNPTVGTTAITFSQLNKGTDLQAGTGITISGNTVSINTGYVGQTSITTLGTITTGTWNGSAISLTSYASGTLQAAQFPALTGDITTSAGSLATTLGSNVVSYAKFQQVAANSLVGNATGSLANATGITLGATLAFSGSALQTAALTGDVTASANSFVTTVAKINGATLGSTTATSGNLLIGSGSQWVSTAVSGDVTITSGGVTAIGAGKVTAAMLANTYTQKYSATIGDGSSTSITVTHNLNTRDVIVRVYDATSYNEIQVEIDHTTVNAVTVVFATAPATNAFRVVVIG